MNEERMLIVGNRLKLIRSEAKMKQKEFAEQFGIATTTYSGYEIGKHEPTIDFLINVADTYKLSLDYVVGRSVSKEGLLQDEINNDFQETLIKPFIDNGQSTDDALEAFAQRVDAQMKEIKEQLAEMRKKKE